MIVRAIALYYQKDIILSCCFVDLAPGHMKSYSEGCRRQRAKGETINEAIIIGKEEGGLHKLKGHSEAAMTHAIEESM
jgi:hypothetical protein